VLAVKAGRAAYERDGVLFPEADFDEPLLDALQLVATANGGRLRILDFGGALGSNYWRHRSWLSDRGELCWDIVEQPQFVAAGRQHLRDTPLQFFMSVEEAEAATRHDVLLCAGVLQYLEDPFSTLATWIDRGWPYLLFNNLPLHRTAPDYLTVQHVPPAIYSASYPVWFLNREHFLSRFEGRYETVSEFASEAVWPMGWKRYPSTGLLLRRIQRP
jgi:putative methyltransferase (TIGR04325 family)